MGKLDRARVCALVKGNVETPYEHDPQLSWAGKAEHMSFEAPTVSLRVHERIEPRTIVETVRRRNGAEPAPTPSGVRVFVDRDPVFPHSLPARSAKAPTTRLPKSRYMSMAMAITLAVLLGGCGGGGSQRPDGDQGEMSSPVDPGLLRAEYERQGGLDIIKAGAMHERGGTGDGIVVALFDSGSGTHPELSGKYVYESKVDIDCKTVEPGQTCTPQVIDAADELGHGTFLAGLIVAPRDGEGIVGVAYEAKLASVAISTGDLTEGQYASWLAGLVPQIDKMIDLGVLVTNNSWGTPLVVVRPGPGLSPSRVRELMPIDKYQEYVDAGGVQVWASGNDQGIVPQVEGAAPYFFPDLEKGWLVVGAVNLDGGTSSWYSHWCGLAADWCLVAPAGIGTNPFNSEAEYEGLTSSSLNGGYGKQSGTSVAAPLVTGAIASLKSMFPNLSYHQIRNRILATADKGVYDFTPVPDWVKKLGGDSSYIYGQGLLDLDAASSPVGGTSIPMTGSAYGSVVATRSTGANLPAAAVDRYFAGRTLLVLDNFQRAPFRIAADAFAERHGPLLAMSDLRLGMAERDGSGKAGYSTVGFGGTDFRNGGDPDGRARGVLGSGARVIEGMSAFTGIDGPSDGLYRMANDAVGLAVRVASGAAGEMFAGFAANVTSERVGARTFGAAGWAPRAVAALTFVGQDAKDSVGLLAAPSLKRPMGWDGAGAFALSGGAYELSYTREIASGEAYRLGFAGRLVHLETEAGPLLRFEDATMATAEVGLSLALGQRTTLTAGLGMERALTPAMGRLRLPSTIDESGRLGFEEVEVDGSEFLSLDRGTLNLRYTPTEGMSLGAGLTVVRDGFDDSQAIAGLQANIAF